MRPLPKVSASERELTCEEIAEELTEETGEPFNRFQVSMILSRALRKVRKELERRKLGNLDDLITR